MALQGDFFIRREADLLIRDQPALAAIDRALPDKPFLKPYEILEVLPISEDVIYIWIRQFRFVYMDIGAGSTRPRYAIDRKTFLEFLATRVNYIR